MRDGVFSGVERNERIGITGDSEIVIAELFGGDEGETRI